MATKAIKFGSFDLDSYLASWQGSVRRRVNEQVIPRSDGVRIDLGRLSGYEVSVVGGLEADDPVSLRTALEGLKEALFGQGKEKLRQFDDRYRQAQCVDLIVTNPAGSALEFADFEARFLAEEPYEIADALSTKVEVITTNPQSFTAVTGGTAPVRPVIEVLASGSALVDAVKLTNETEGAFLAYHGTVAAGKTLIVDCDQQVAEIDGASVLADFEGDFFQLAKGSNSLKFEGDPCTVTLKWYDRWY